ncbi:MAG: hypothetical protein IT374_22375 [Polyangiaceae bacterium]|nr:hypothetical protein [Polyangiaceae bacterium]
MTPSKPRALPGPLRAIVLGTIACLVVVFVLHRVLKAPHREADQPSRTIGARLELAAGDVTVGEGAKAERAVSGAPLPSGARVATGKGSRALVRSGDGASVFMRGESDVLLGQAAVELRAGEVWLEAPKIDGDAVTFKVGAHLLTASDAGLSVARAGDQVTVYVARGLAVLSSPGGRVEINAGEQAVATATGAPKLGQVAFWQDWTGGMGDARPGRGSVGGGAGRIYGIEGGRAGAPARKLGIAKQLVKVVLRDGLAETEVDQTFSNPGGSAIEGYYWFTVPARAIVTSFALETNGQLVEGEVIEKKEAAARYDAAKRSAQDPAILEWVDGLSYRARIFPIAANGTRRVVLRYLEVLPQVDAKTRYVYPLRAEDGVRYDEFSLSVDLGDKSGAFDVASSLDASVEDGGRRVTMRRSGYQPRADFQLELARKSPPPAVRAWRFASGGDQADYVMLRYVPDQDFAKAPAVKGEVVVVVDTSAGGDERERALRGATAEAILRALSEADRFSVVALDVKPTVVYPEKGQAAATEAEIAKALEKLAEHTAGGATDLGAMFEPALERLHGAEQPAILYVGDGLATSGEATPEALVDRLRRSLTGSRARFFAVAVGTEANHPLLGELARTGGGQLVRVDEAERATGEALRLIAAVKTPTVTELEVGLGAGLDQPFLSATGKLARGEELLLLARTHHKLPEKVTVKGRLFGQPFSREYAVPLESGIVTSLVPRLWAAEYARRLAGSGASPEEHRAKILDLGVEYGLMTPFTSILALDSEAAYARSGVRRRRSPLRGVRLTELASDQREHELAALFGAAVDPGATAGCAKRSAPADRAEAQAATEDESPMTKSEAAPAPRPGAPAAVAAPVAPTVAGPPTEPDPSQQQGIGAGTGGGGLSKGLGLGGLDARGGGAAPAAPGREKAKVGDVDDAPAPTPKPVAVRPADKRAPAAPAPPQKPTPAPPHSTPPSTPQLIVARRQPSTCSDAASRPLAERVVLWKKRMKQATGARELLTQFELARGGCELPDWRDEAALLDLLQARITTEDAAEAVLGHFAGEREAQRYVAQAVLRRTVDVRLSAAVGRALYGGRVDWQKVDRDVLDAKPEDRVKTIREAMLQAPGDPNGDFRLVRALAKAGQGGEALAYGRRLRDRGLMTPSLALALGDVLADAKETDEAQRTYSEIVEFDGESAASRQALGDVFLRNGWYGGAYRQYKTLTELDGKRATAWLRLAAAAAGAGRVDEALRIERQVATGEGTPGPDDPRHWARLWSGARLGQLWAAPPAGTERGAIARKLKELSLFSGPGTLSIVAWEDLDARLTLGAADAKQERLAGEATDAGQTGLVSLLTSGDTWKSGAWALSWKSEPRRAVKATLVVLEWDGKAFAVQVKKIELQPEDVKAPL